MTNCFYMVLENFYAHSQDDKLLCEICLGLSTAFPARLIQRAAEIAGEDLAHGSLLVFGFCAEMRMRSFDGFQEIYRRLISGLLIAPHRGRARYCAKPERSGFLQRVLVQMKVFMHQSLSQRKRTRLDGFGSQRDNARQAGLGAVFEYSIEDNAIVCRALRQFNSDFDVARRGTNQTQCFVQIKCWHLSFS